MPTEPLTLRTSSTVPDGIAGTCTYTTPEFSLGTMTGRLGGSSLPLVARFADEDYPQAIVATVHPTDGYVSSLQHNGMALCAIHFDRIGFGTRKQAYISLRLGHRDQIDEVLVRGAAWNQEDTGIGQREALVLSVADCYVGLMIGRCGPVEGDTLRRVKPGELRWAGAGKLERLQLDIYGRRSDFTVRQPLNDVRVTLAACVVPASAYASVEEFADAFKQARISEEVEQIVVSLKEESELPDRKPLDGLIPDPKPKKDMPRKRVLQQTITWKVMDAEFELVEDLYAAALLSSTVDDVEVRSESLWSAPGFSYPADTDLDAALAAGGY